MNVYELEKEYDHYKERIKKQLNSYFRASKENNFLFHPLDYEYVIFIFITRLFAIEKYFYENPGIRGKVKRPDFNFSKIPQEYLKAIIDRPDIAWMREFIIKKTGVIPPAIYPISDFTWKKLTVILITNNNRSNPEITGLKFKYDNKPLQDYTLEKLGLIDKRFAGKYKKPIDALENLNKLIDDEPLEHEKQKVALINQKLKRIFNAYENPISYDRADGSYRILFMTEKNKKN
jgi:hypothetical protein